MLTFLLVVTVLLYGGLVLVASMTPHRSVLSVFELNRRKESAVTDPFIKLALDRERYNLDLAALLRALQALLLVLFVLFCVMGLGWFVGIIAALVGALEYNSLARFAWVHEWAQKLYDKIEPYLLKFATDYPVIFRVIRTVPAEEHSVALQSREELLNLVDKSTDILSSDEKTFISSGLHFPSKLVSSIMTPRGMIDSVNADDLLGPLMLDDLHKTGHSRFPVIDGDLDHVVGIVYIRNLLGLDVKKSPKARAIMSEPVYYIKDTQNLQHALAAFLRTHHHLFVVVNEFRETVGLLSLEDVIEELLGRKIIDEFDTHDDLRAVATRNPRSNNNPPKHTDV